MSFAKLLETGASADTVSGRRALGFSETGIMGLHFAMGESGAAGDPQNGPAGNDCDDAVMALAKNEGALADGRLAAIPIRGISVDAAADAHFPLGQDHPFSRDHKAAHRHLPSSLQNEPVGPGQALTEAGEGDEGPARILSRLAARLRTGGENSPRIQLKLTESGGGISIIVEGIDQDDESSREFERIAREVAGEFGVTISDLVITATSSIDTVTKIGRRP